MKKMMVFILMIFSINCFGQSTSVEYKTKDTVYLLVENPPHSCDFQKCDLKGLFFFYWKGSQDDVYINSLHWKYPFLNFYQCKRLFEYQKQFKTL